MDIEIRSGIAIVRAGEMHAQGREEVKAFEYREGESLPAFWGPIFEQLFTWAEQKGVELGQLVTYSPKLRSLVELSGGKVGAGRT